MTLHYDQPRYNNTDTPRNQQHGGMGIQVDDETALRWNKYPVYGKR